MFYIMAWQLRSLKLDIQKIVIYSWCDVIQSKILPDVKIIDRNVLSTLVWVWSSQTIYLSVAVHMCNFEIKRNPPYVTNTMIDTFTDNKPKSATKVYEQG